MGYDGIVFGSGFSACTVWPSKMNALPRFETSVTTDAKAQCHFSEDADVCYHITNHISHIIDVMLLLQAVGLTTLGTEIR